MQPDEDESVGGFAGELKAIQVCSPPSSPRH
jgi:hypothetical protein